MKTLNTYLVLFLLIAFTACESFVETNPQQSIDADEALTSPEAVRAATNSVFSRLRAISQYGRDMIAIPEVLTDNSIQAGTGIRLTGEANNQPGAHINNWQNSYYAINEANLVLRALDENDFSVDFKNEIEGQIRFLLGLYYHNLARVYAYDPTAIIPENNRGGIPLLKTGIRNVNEIVLAGRAPINEVYEYIYENLERAYTLLEGINTQTPHYASHGAAAALLSRVALYNGDYQKVIIEADKALASGIGTFVSQENYFSSWRQEVHPESIFEVVFMTNENLGQNESLRATFTTRFNDQTTTATSQGLAVFSPELLALYEDVDVRRSIIYRGLGMNSGVFETTKFFSRGGINNLDNVPVIRVSELYLNKAEAHARLGQNLQANENLNIIRERAGLQAMDLEGESLIEEILKQRRLELSFEGHRSFDLKRLGLDIVKEFGTIPFEDFRTLARIPIREVDINSNLEQNPGY
ncbi:RagB/SusD family nutrient uptake outer membrane protein [Belliella kenyensis]|uniref:RagB/SusD family nutrient uptake outer membrane protein n=1 Tax=Belliella kenyensis TaxID=1472724 RepID=A0ABV8ES97_9BACT|nr:RagB/SusD family nutrient uptake outer membrane protein [Belliella kenyensis]MCH7402867.1 RagB/SusD family nutrient uptake outer membrane protein [Belliella kenyensis]MDN3602573.1 RagB/SusD family nutrient uptake outer membrane protein [Belliella kenyensis]